MLFKGKKGKIKTYLKLLDEIGERDFLMPIEEIRLGNQFAELKDVELLKENLLVDKYLNHPNFHVRRVISIAFRNLEEFNDTKINLTMKTFLEEKAHWVVYDAIWFFQDASTNDPEVISKIKSLAATELTPAQKKEGDPSSDATVNMVQMAQETLELMGQ